LWAWEGDALGQESILQGKQRQRQRQKRQQQILFEDDNKKSKRKSFDAKFAMFKRNVRDV